uniref:Uncharacterized protein n=1 Tax=virus sp. ctmTa7 TaxID=2828255 RepID=A0A8S5RCF7_9VIRU|nr:MAG TPA: hypothetical protein [virus sp. ctmTa7]
MIVLPNIGNITMFFHLTYTLDKFLYLPKVYVILV